MPTLAYHAAAATKYSEMTTTDYDKTQQITATLARQTTQIARMGTLANASIAQQFICVFQPITNNGAATPLSKPHGV
jgi:outer membrane protein assembly factor BamD (BamD/ComL family)